MCTSFEQISCLCPLYIYTCTCTCTCCMFNVNVHTCILHVCMHIIRIHVQSLLWCVYVYVRAQGKVAEKRALDRSRSLHARVRHIEMVSDHLLPLTCMYMYMYVVHIHYHHADTV